MKGFDNQTEAYAAPEEVFLNLQKSIPEVEISVKTNETLVRQVIEIAKKDPSLYRPNVLFLMIDQLSRQHFFRKMP